MSTTKQVTATAFSAWPGNDPVEALKIVRGELGTPHTPFLPQLPDRGVGSDAIGRTASLLVELPVDVQPHGWRLVDRPGKDIRRAHSALSTDINILADIAGAEQQPSDELKIELVGPLTLSSALYVHRGERAVSDHGARREIAESLAAGVGQHLTRIQSAVPGTRLVVQVDEHLAASALAGTLPTASGYRTLRSIPGAEATATWTLLVDALRDAGAHEIVFSLAAKDAPLQRILHSGADGFALDVAGISREQWDITAGAVESGKRLWAGLELASSQSGSASKAADQIIVPWRELGLPLNTLGAVRVMPAQPLDRGTPQQGKTVLGRLSAAADAINQRMLG
ncbi:hypothetical protein ACQQCD_01335 [Pseudarthrobacter sp. J1763]|uniref:hypothetical protein n=1 Tax=Pseudarthrobacter sp. J1763 TaxID=3420445 RepID=UPI003D29B1BE